MVQVFPLQIHPFHMKLDSMCMADKIPMNICIKETCTICFQDSINPSFIFHYQDFQCLLNFLSKSKLQCQLQELHCMKYLFRLIIQLIYIFINIFFWILLSILQIFHLLLEISISIPNRLWKARQHYLNVLNHFQIMAFISDSYKFNMKISS